MGERLKPAPKRCDEHARQGTGYGVCDAPLDGHGQCPNAGNHVPTDEVPRSTGSSA